MAPRESERKLAAILVADVVGFSKLAHADEEGTLARLRALRTGLLYPTITSHRGRIVKSTGDGALVEFPSVVEAVRCAIEVQNAMPERNAGVPEDQRVVFRVAIHVGDVVKEPDDDVMGDGVNIAARLEALADPGGICLSEDAYRQVLGKVDGQFQDRGEKALKNIARPMRVYAWSGGSNAPRPPPKAAESEGAKPIPASNIPIAIPRHFLGRDEAIEAIDAALAHGEGRVAITALHGLRGVGKTTLAAAYAERRRSDYRATWWIRAQTESSMRADLAALGVRLGWVAADEKEEPALAAVRERLRHAGEGLLLIYDNAIDAASLKPYLPPGGTARVLVTSNAHAWRAIAAPVEIPVWPKQIGADYLILRTGRDKERADAEALSETLGGLPLAHEQAAAYCERLDVSLAQYRRRFAAAPDRHLDDARHAPAEYRDGTTVAKTFALAIEQAGKLHPAAEPLIVHAALLAPEPIPLFLFAEGREGLGEPLATQLADDGLDEAVAALRAFALVDRETIADERNPEIMTETIRLHRLVRPVAAARRQGEELEAARRALIVATVAVYPEDIFNDPREFPRARRLDALALDLVGGDAPPAGAEMLASLLLNGLAGYRFNALAAYSEARPLFERALAIREHVLGAEHPDTAASLNSLGSLLQAQGNLVGARPLFERALAINERALGSEHPDTATSLTNLAALLQAQGDLAGAQPLYELALTILEKALGPDHIVTANCLNGLAVLLRNRGDLVRARPLFERALAIRERELGAEHPSTARSLNNLALLLDAEGDLGGARRLLQRALASRERAFGPDHPDVANGLNNLAHLLVALGDPLGARPLHERALAIREKALGPDHPKTAESLSNLARLFQDQSDLAGARLLYERALAICEKALGAQHPNTSTVRRNLAILLADQGDFDGAAALGSKTPMGKELPDPLLARRGSRNLPGLGGSGPPASPLSPRPGQRPSKRRPR
jgi:class 3 adenylate cyclase/Tfp pilus assembly protein PilF